MTTVKNPKTPAGWKIITLEVFLAVLTLVAVLLTSCSHIPEEKNASPGIELPETFSIYEGSERVQERWWEGFGSDELNSLLDDALEGNLTLKESTARLGQSRALAVKAGADRLPDLRLTAALSETRRDSSATNASDSSKSLTLASSYELDLWGRVSASHRSAILDVEASQEELYTVAITIASEVTLKWLETISVRRQLALLDEQLKTNQTILKLMELRYLKGFATALDIYQQRQILAETVAAFPALQARLQTLVHELAVLTGKQPRADLGLSAAEFPEIEDLTDTGVPADLLANRPDVRAAGLTLRATEFEVAAARAGRLPAVNLSATAGFSDDSFQYLLDNWFTTLAASLTYTVFNSGALKAEVEKQERIMDERLATYKEVVLTAIREVEDALIREQKQVEYIAALDEQLAIARDSFREAQQRYRKGLIDYLPALSALISTQRFERTVVKARFDRLSYRVQLHRALGGSWMPGFFDHDGS